MQSRDVQVRRKNQDIFKRKETVAASRKRNATTVTSKDTTQINVESQEDHNKLLRQKRNQNNKDRS